MVCTAPISLDSSGGENGCRNHCGHRRWVSKRETETISEGARNLVSRAQDSGRGRQRHQVRFGRLSFQENERSRNSLLVRQASLLANLDDVFPGGNLEHHAALMHMDLSGRLLINFQIELAGIKLRTGDADGSTDGVHRSQGNQNQDRAALRIQLPPNPPEAARERLHRAFSSYLLHFFMWPVQASIPLIRTMG